MFPFSGASSKMMMMRTESVAAAEEVGADGAETGGGKNHRRVGS